MSRVYAYYEVVNNPLLKKMCMDYQKQHNKAWRALRKLFKSIGAQSAYMSQSTLGLGQTGLRGFGATKAGTVPTDCRYDDRSGCYVPDRKTPGGKVLAADLIKVQNMFPTVSKIKELIGFSDIWMGNGVMYSMGFTYTSKGRIFFSFPLFTKKELKTIETRQKKAYSIPVGLKEVLSSEYFNAFNK